MLWSTAKTKQVIRDFEQTFAGLAVVNRLLLTLLAIGEPLSLTGWTQAAGFAGARESATRALSTSSLRSAAESLIALGLVRRTEDGHFRCGRDQRTLCLRLAAERPGLDHLVQARARQGHVDEVDRARIAIHRQLPEAPARLAAVAAHFQENATMLALEVLHPFDETRWATLPPALGSKLLELALTSLEHSPADFDSPYHWVVAQLPAAPTISDLALSACAGIAVLRGDLGVLQALAETGRSGSLGPRLRIARAVMEGRYDDASREAQACPDFVKADHFGVLALLFWIALRTSQPTSARLARLSALGARKGAPFQQTFRIAQAMDAGALSGAEVLPKFAPNVGGDCLTSLWLSLKLPQLDIELDSFGAARLAGNMAKMSRSYANAGYRWLADQLGQAAWSIHRRLKPRERALTTAVVSAPAGPMAPPLAAARTSRPAWEISLDRLAELAGMSASPRSEPASAAEQIVWRVTVGGSIEPYLQKRGGNGKWSGGRKLALKHLLGKSPQLTSLPTEDQRVAQYAREDRRVSYGYPTVEHYMDLGAWSALVGHPRVYLHGSDTAIRVVRGELKVRVRSEALDTIVTIEPGNLKEGVNLRELDGELLVYRLDGQAKLLATALGAAGLRVPSAGKTRLLGLLEQLAPVLPIESTEATNAKRVPADTTPRMRLVPSQGGLVATLLVRPLGSGGPLLTAGAGAPTLIGQIAGETVQVERDLGLETKSADLVVAACQSLIECETGTNSWFVADPMRCLELVSALSALGDKVAVEWPQGTPLRVRSRLGRRALQGKLRHGHGFFELRADVSVDSELSLELEQLLELVAQHPGRFVQLASGEYLELEQELRDVLEGISASRRESRGERGAIALPASAVSVLDQLTGDGSALAFDAEAGQWRERFDAAWRKQPKVPKGFQGELREYQLEGFRWLARLAELELGACLADDMGLGKTIQLIALLLHRAASGPALIVAPTSVCENWRREIERFAPSLSVRAYWGADRDGLLSGLARRSVVVTSYALLQQDAETLHAIEWSTAVLDEAQLIKNADTLRAKAAFGLQAKARIVATGTPVENHAGDIFSLFHFLNPGLLGSWKRFAAAMNERGSSASRAYRRLMQPFVLRRTKAQVLDDLPPLTEIQRTVLLSAAEAKLYESVRKVALGKLSSAGKSPQARVQVLAELTRLRRLCCHPELVSPGIGLGSSKLESLLELLEELVAGHHRVLVFSQFTDVLALVRPLLEAKQISYQYLDGATTMKRRAAAVDAFQQGDGDVFLISLKAGGFGLNLTAADYVVHVDPWWNPAVEAQASDRAHRIGQTRPVTVYRLVTAGTIEAAIVELHHKKRDLADAVLEGTDQAARLSADELKQLLAAR